MKNIAVFILIALTSLSCAKQDEKALLDSYFVQEEKLYIEGEYEQALAVLNQIQQIDKSNYLIYERRAWALYKMVDRTNTQSQILSNLNTAIELAPQKASSSYYLRASLANKHDDVQSAMSDLTTAIELAPKKEMTYQPYIVRAIIYGSQSNFNAAINDATKAIELHPREIRSYLILAAAYDELGQYEAAMENLKIAQYLDPRSELVLETQKHNWKSR